MSIKLYDLRTGHTLLTEFDTSLTSIAERPNHAILSPFDGRTNRYELPEYVENDSRFQAFIAKMNDLVREGVVYPTFVPAARPWDTSPQTDEIIGYFENMDFSNLPYVRRNYLVHDNMNCLFRSNQGGLMGAIRAAARTVSYFLNGLLEQVSEDYVRTDSNRYRQATIDAENLFEEWWEPQIAADRERQLTETWNDVLSGAVMEHSRDAVQALVGSQRNVPERAIGIEMEYNPREGVRATWSREYRRGRMNGDGYPRCGACYGEGGRYEENPDFDLDEMDEEESERWVRCTFCNGDGYIRPQEPEEEEEHALKVIAKAMPERSYIPKYDGSLESGGVEFVSIPLKLRDAYTWLNALTEAAQPFFNDDYAGAGMHIHLSRTWFHSKGHLARFYGLLHGPLRPFVRAYVGLQRAREMGEWARADEDEWRTPVLNGEVTGSHYDGVSLDGRYTVEVRFFKSTLNATEAKANLDFLLAVVEYSSSAGRSKYPYQHTSFDIGEVETDFLEWVLTERRKEYRYFAEWLLSHAVLQRKAKPRLEAAAAKDLARRTAKKQRKLMAAKTAVQRKGAA